MISDISEVELLHILHIYFYMCDIYFSCKSSFFSEDHGLSDFSS